MPQPISVADAAQIISDICSFSGWNVIYYTKDTLVRAIGLHKAYQKHFWDTMIVATMQEAGVAHIFTENKKDFTVFPNLTVRNPF